MGVIFPRDEDDLRAALAVAREEKLPFLARGAGTSLSGQAITSGVIADLSAWNTIRIEGDVAHVGTGAIIDAIDRAASPGGLRFGPAPASSNRATIGGLMINNGTGARSLIYGMASDHLLSARVMLSDGTVRVFRRDDLDPADPLTRDVLAAIEPVIGSPRWPRTWRNASGLDLRGVRRRNSLLPLLCGSEGSLAILLDAEVKLVPRPARSQLALFYYDDLVSAMKHVPAILETKPSAVELMDRALIELARKSPKFELKVIQDSPAAALVVEYDDRDATSLARSLGARIVLDDPAAQREVWNTRKEGLGILCSRRGTRRPIPFIEDCAVPVEVLPEYVTRLDAIIRRNGTEGAYYAHASAGCLHIRPLLDLHDPRDRDRMTRITEEAVDLVAELGGTLTGEHGDGRSKSPYLERVFGPELVAAFDAVRCAFDPPGILRPAGETALRIDAAGERARRAFPNLLKWPEPFEREVERCNGEAACRKLDGVMCPSFQSTRDESLSTRGRANLLRAWLEGEPVEDALDETLRKCLGCKACSSECPSQVDMSALKAEYRNTRPPTMSDYFFSHFAELAELGRRMGSAATLFPGVVKRIAGIHENCDLPAPSADGFLARCGSTCDVAGADAVLFVDTHIEYFEPEIGLAAMELFAALGIKVAPLRPGCCQRPSFSRGMLRKAARALDEVVIPGEQPVIVIEPSCLSMLRDDAPKLVPALAPLARRVISLEAFLLRHVERLELLLPRERVSVLLHTHCHQKATGESADVARLLALAFDVKPVHAGCCGMAGSFGYERATYPLAVAIAEDRYLPALRGAGESRIAAPGRSCREMAARAAIRARHPVELLAEAFRLAAGNPSRLNLPHPGASTGEGASAPFAPLDLD
jgi:FAD/FMN-containing dehydrogenase/Fe-S oxidoreductase